MRIQLIALAVLFSFSAFASQEKEIQALFKKYLEVVNEHKVELVDDVFSQKFLKEDGGKDEFIKKVKDSPKTENKASPNITFKKGVVDEMYFVKMNPNVDAKAKKGEHVPEFIVVKENGKLKIEGTISDDD